MRNKISQREARANKKRLIELERRVPLSASTRGVRWEIASFSLNPACMREMQMGARFGQSLRFEQFGDKVILFAFTDSV